MSRKAGVSVPIGLFAMAWLQPLHIPPWTSFHSEFLAFLAVTIALISALLDQRGNAKSRVGMPLLAVGLLSIPIIAAMQWAVALIPYGGDAVVIGLYGTFAALAVAAGYHSKPSSLTGSRVLQRKLPSMPEQFSVAILGVAFLSVLIALVQTLELWLHLEPIVRSASLRRPGANFGQPNHLATFILFGAAALTYLSWKRHLRFVLFAAGLVLLLLGLAITESRTGALSLLALGVWIALGRQLSGRIQATVAWVALTGAVYILLLLGWPTIHEHILNPGGGNIFQSVNTAVGSRLTVWPQLWHAALLKPWWGWGLRNVSVAHNEVLHLYSSAEPFTYAHNIVIDMAVGAGLPLAITVIVVVARFIHKNYFKKQGQDAWLVLALTLILMIHSLLEYPFAYAYFLYPVLYLLGGLWAVEDNKRRILNICRPLAYVLVMITLGISAFVLKEYIILEEEYRVARFKALNVGEVPANHSKPEIYVLTQLDAMVSATTATPVAGMSAGQLLELRNAAQRFPWVAIQNRYAVSLALNNQKEEAVRQLKVMRAMHGEAVFKALQQDWAAKANNGAVQLRGVAEF